MITDEHVPALQGMFPSWITTSSIDGEPNTTVISQIWYVDEKEVALATKHIYTNSMFGVTLDELMAIQSEKRPELEIPWIQVSDITYVWNHIILLD